MRWTHGVRVAVLFGLMSPLCAWLIYASALAAWRAAHPLYDDWKAVQQFNLYVTGLLAVIGAGAAGVWFNRDVQGVVRTSSLATLGRIAIITLANWLAFVVLLSLLVHLRYITTPSSSAVDPRTSISWLNFFTVLSWLAIPDPLAFVLLLGCEFVSVWHGTRRLGMTAPDALIRYWMLLLPVGIPVVAGGALFVIGICELLGLSALSASSFLLVPIFVLCAGGPIAEKHRDTLFLKPSACQHCGYSLVGNVSGRCPECGASIERFDDRFDK